MLTTVNSNNLLNFLSFLQVAKTDKNLLIEDSRKSKNYISILRYLQNTNSSLLDIDSSLKKRKKFNKKERREF